MEECVHINVEDKQKSVNDVPQVPAFDVNVMKMEQQIAKIGLSDESQDVEERELIQTEQNKGVLVTSNGSSKDIFVFTIFINNFL